MKRLLGTSPTSVMLRVALYDSSSTVGALLAGLAYDTASLAVAVAADGGAGASVLTLEDITTIGTYEAPTSAAHARFKAVDGTDMAGVYEVHLHNDTLASIAGAIVKISGAANLAPCLLELQTGPVAAHVVTMAAAAIQSIWDALTSALTTAGSVGKLIVDYLAAIKTVTDKVDTALEQLDPPAWNFTSESLQAVPMPDVRSDIGMATSNMDAQLAAIKAEADKLGTPAGASLAADIAAIPDAIVPGTGYATEASVQEALGLLQTAISLGAVHVPVASSGGGAVVRYVQALFDEISITLRDPNGNAYQPALLTTLYNRAIFELADVLSMIGAEVAFPTCWFLGDGVHQDYEVPADFRAFVPGTLRPRSPATATANYTHGRALDHVDRLDVTVTPETIGAPGRFCLLVDGTTQYVRFNSILPSGEILDALYVPRVPRVELADVGSTKLPWLGLLDELIARTIELYAREGLEFTVEAREAWRQRAASDAIRLMGLRHLQSQTMTPSLWRRGGR